MKNEGVALHCCACRYNGRLFLIVAAASISPLLLCAFF
jgi:hypothetical protein